VAVQIIDHPDWTDTQIAEALQYEGLERDFEKDLELVAEVRLELTQA
jgi:hypothetical protein